MPSVRPATMEDLEYMAPRLREADVREMKALDGSEPYPALVESFNASVLANVMVDDEGKPFAVYGVAPADWCSDCTVGVSWMLGTEDLKKHSMWFLRNFHWMLDEMHEHFPTFGNFADVRNTVHIRWLKWAGFEFGEKYPRNGTYFWEHWRTKDKCASQPQRR